MAYLDNVILSDYQDLTTQEEKRKTKYGMLDLAVDSTPKADYIPPSVREQFANATGLQNFKIPVIKDQEATVVTTPGFSNIPINMGEAETYYFSAYDIFTGFRLYPASFKGSQVDAQSYINNRMRAITEAAAKKADQIINTNLDARKTQQLDFTTQVSQGDGTFTFSTSTDTLTINKAAQKDTMLTNLNTLMIANKLEGDYNIVTSPAGLSAASMNVLKYGDMNDKNLVQFDGAIPMNKRYESHQLTPGSDNFTGFLVRDGGVGVFENFLYDFAAGTEFAGHKWSVSDVALQNIRMRANVFVNREATEATSLISSGTNQNLKMTHFEEMALWFRFYVVYRYNSDIANKANDIVKIVGATS